MDPDISDRSRFRKTNIAFYPPYGKQYMYIGTNSMKLQRTWMEGAREDEGNNKHLTIYKLNLKKSKTRKLQTPCHLTPQTLQKILLNVWELSKSFSDESLWEIAGWQSSVPKHDCGETIATGQAESIECLIAENQIISI